MFCSACRSWPAQGLQSIWKLKRSRWPFIGLVRTLPIVIINRQ